MIELMLMPSPKFHPGGSGMMRSLSCHLFPERYHIRLALLPKSLPYQSLAQPEFVLSTYFRYSIKRVKNVMSSSVKATPFPVVLRNNARGGVGDLLRGSLKSRSCCVLTPIEPFSMEASFPMSPSGMVEFVLFIMYPPNLI
jgi:hypothetical protein